MINHPICQFVTNKTTFVLTKVEYNIRFSKASVRCFKNIMNVNTCQNSELLAFLQFKIRTALRITFRTVTSSSFPSFVEENFFSGLNY